MVPIVQSNFPVLRGRTIRVDENGLFCLNDIWLAAGFKRYQKPSDWRRLEITFRLTTAVLERITGKNRNWSKNDFRTVIYAKTGQLGGTYADVRLALAYAEYLNPKLALEVKEVFLRYKAADPTLADEILQRATPIDNEWAGTRAIGRSVRAGYTAVLQKHGAVGGDYALCTNAIYLSLFNKTAKQLKASRAVGRARPLRDQMTTPELAYVMASEALSSERIEEEHCEGGGECLTATGKSARFIRQAIEFDRSDRRGRPQQLL